MLANIIKNAKKTGIGGGGGGIVTGGDPYYSAVSLLLSMDGTNGSTTFTDSGPNAIAVTAVGNTQISTTQSKYGGASGYFDGSTAYLIQSSNLTQFGTADFTVEFWMRYSSATGYRQVIGPNLTAAGLAFGTNNFSGSVKMWATTLTIGYAGSSVLSADTWYHMSFVRQSGVIKFYLNGNLDGTHAVATNFTETGGAVGAMPSGANKFNGYIDDLRISLFARYTSTFTPPTAALPTTASSTPADPYYGYTSLLLHMDGSSGSTNFVDSGPNALAVTAVGNTQISTTQSKYGGASGYFDGNGDYLTTPNSTLTDFGTGDFTIEAWSYGLGTIAGKWGSQVAWVLIANSTNITLGVGNSGTYSASLVFSSTISGTTWNHIAVTRSGTTVRCFLNGTQIGSSITNSANLAATATLDIGVTKSNLSSYMNGYIDDLRITKYARYTSAFAPPAQAHLEYANGNDRHFSNVSLLLHMDGVNGSTTFTDNSSNALAVTAVGSPTTSTTQLKFGTSAAAVGGTNYLTLPNNSSLFDFGSGDFTIEFWFYYSSSQSGQIQIFARSANQSGSLSPIFIEKKSGTNYIGLSWTSDGTNWVLNAKSGTVAMTPNAWNHVAIVRRSGIFYSYINGTQDWSDSTSSTSAIQAGGDVLAIGRWPKYANSPGTYYIDDFRITKGVSRYSANFTPPTSAYPNA